MSTPPSLADALKLHQQGALAEAAGLYQQIISAEPENADAWHLMGVVAHQQGKNPLAAKLIQNAISLSDGVADFYSNLGKVYNALADDAAAEDAYRKALEVDPRHVKALSNLAGQMRSNGQFSVAVDYARRAVAAGPEDAEAHNNLGNALKDLGNSEWIEDAIKAYRRAAELAPDFALAHWNLSLALLSLGKFEEGFDEMRWRWQWPGFPAVARQFEQPHLSSIGEGVSVKGQRVFQHAEQGLGDTIHFIRYANLLREQGAHIIFECPPSLALLIEQTDLVDELVLPGQPLPDFDLHAALLDLPSFCRTSETSIPAPEAYLSVPSDIRVKWQEKLAAYDGFKVGLNWCGNPASPVEKFRRLPPQDLRELAEVGGVSWFSLQKGENADQVPPVSDAFKLIDTGPEALVETAGLIQALDLVITSDTAVAHLAGALGKPVWILLHHAPDWRWQTESSISSWYPTARLFRQKQPGAWGLVIDAVKSELEKTL